MSNTINNLPSINTTVTTTSTVPLLSTEQQLIDKMIHDTKMVINAFTKIKQAVIDEKDDMTNFSGRPYLKKSAWVKIALAFNISPKIDEIIREKTDDGNYIVRFKVSATMPWTGRSETEIGIAEKEEFDRRNKVAKERGKREIPFTVHNCETLAYSRAYNRVISKLVGGGQISAEEITVSAEDDIPISEIYANDNEDNNKNTEGNNTQSNPATPNQIAYIKHLSKNFPDVKIDYENMSFNDADILIKKLSDATAKLNKKG